MNERIEVVSDRVVRIKRNDDQVPPCTEVSVNRADGMHLTHSALVSGMWDERGRAALRDCINCLDSCGDFGALRDDDPRPFVGKEMRLDNGERVTILQTGLNFANACHCMRADGTIISRAAGDLLPLAESPKPKYRPLTALEAFHQLGRKVTTHSREGATFDREIKSVSKTCVSLEGQHLGFDDLLGTEYKWEDTGLPCGVLVEPVPA